MRVLLIEIAGLGPTFFAEPPPEADAPRHEGIWGWVARKRSSVVDELNRGRGVLGRTLGGLWRRLQGSVAHDEPLLRALRHADRIELDHPAARSTEAVDRAWAEYLKGCVRTHRRWLIVDAILLPLSLLLVPLPGPNIVGFWLVYRVVVHFVAVRGATRCRLGPMETEYRPRVELDGALDLGDHDRIGRLAEALAFPALAETLARVGPRDAGSPR